MNDDVCAEFMTCRAGNIQWAGEIINDGVHQNLHAFFLERGTAQNRNEFNLAGQAADGCLEHGRGDRLFFQNQVGDLVVLVGDGVNQFRERGFGALLIFRSNFPDLIIETFVRLARPPINYLLVDDVYHAFKTAGDRFAFGFGRTLT